MEHDSFEFDSQSASKADCAASSIDESGAYTGVFIQAFRKEAESGAMALELAFKDENGGKANITIWYKSGKAKGSKPIDRGVDAINSIMACMGMKSLKGESGTVQTFKDGAKQIVSVTVFPSLLEKPIGVVLQKELFTKNNGNDGYRFNFVLAFNAKTKQTASEVVSGTGETIKLKKVVHALKDVDTRKVVKSQPVNQYEASGYHTNSNDSIDDDIPF